jgi:hypothetical protein
VDPLRLDDLPADARVELERRAASEGIPPEAYALKLVLGGLAASPTSPAAAAPSAWKAWLADIDRREPVEGIDAAAALADARREREAELGAAIAGGFR